MRIILMAVLLFTLPAAAQFDNTGDDEWTKNNAFIDVSVRLGALNRKGITFNGRNNTLFEGGGALSFYLLPETLAHRFKVQVGADVASLSREQFFDFDLGAEVQINQSLFFLNSSIGFEVIQAPRFDLTVHYGGALTVDDTNFLIETFLGEFNNVCHLSAFAAECPTFKSFLGNAGVGFRVFPRENGRFFLGMDYTRFAGGINQTVGTFGWAF